jgi:hypothetical protein
MKPSCLFYLNGDEAEYIPPTKMQLEWDVRRNTPDSDGDAVYFWIDNFGVFNKYIMVEREVAK